MRLGWKCRREAFGGGGAMMGECTAQLTAASKGAGAERGDKHGGSGTVRRRDADDAIGTAHPRHERAREGNKRIPLIGAPADRGQAGNLARREQPQSLQTAAAGHSMAAAGARPPAAGARWRVAHPRPRMRMRMRELSVRCAPSSPSPSASSDSSSWSRKVSWDSSSASG